MVSRKPHLSLYHNKTSGYWYARVYWPDTKKQTAYRLPVHSEAEARVALARFERNMLPGLMRDRATEAPADTPGPKLRDLVTWYVETHLPYLGRTNKTIAHYDRVLRDFVTFCSQRHIGRPQQISTRIVQEWQKWLSEFRPAGARRVAQRDELLALRHFFDEAADAGELPERLDISWRIPGKGKSSRFRALTLAELTAFLAGVREHALEIYPVIAWTAFSGWRIGDVLDLRWGEILPSGHIDRAQLKTSKGMLYPVTSHLRQILDGERAKLDGAPGTSAHVFLDGQGCPWRYNLLAKRLEYACKTKIGVQASTRDLRKTFASHMAMRGCPPNVLKELLGHEDIAMTLGYYVDVDLESMAKWSDEYGRTLRAASTENSEPAQNQARKRLKKRG